MKVIQLFCLFLLIYNLATAQDTLTAEEGTMKDFRLRKNAVHGHIGAFPILLINTTASYERSLFVSKPDDIDWRGKLGIGLFATFGGSSTIQSLSFGFIKGKRKHHLEMFGGLGRFVEKGTYHDFGDNKEFKNIRYFAVGNIGYRNQKPEGWFIFRTGVGFPDLIYLGIGFAL